jgi:hypothetical protein
MTNDGAPLSLGRAQVTGVGREFRHARGGRARTTNDLESLIRFHVEQVDLVTWSAYDGYWIVDVDAQPTLGVFHAFELSLKGSLIMIVGATRL